MTEFNKEVFIRGLATKINSYDAMLENLFKIASDWRVRLDTEGGMDFIQELGKKSVLGGKRPFAKWGGTFEDYQKALAELGEELYEYIRIGLRDCPKSQKKTVKDTVVACINLAKNKTWRASPNRDFLKKLFNKIMNRILGLMNSLELSEVPSKMPAPSVLWGGKRWRVIPVNYVKKLERHHEQLHVKKSNVPTNCKVGIFPAELFNGLQINYTISGSKLGKPKDSFGFTCSRSFEGQLAGNTLTVSGTGIFDKSAAYDTEYGSFFGVLSVTVSAGKNTKNYDYTQPKGSGPMRQPFTVSVPIRDDATSASFSIRVTFVNPRFGDRIVVVNGSLKRNVPTILKHPA